MIDKIVYFFRRLFAKKAPLELSYSKISAYRFCPWKYKLLYVEGWRVPPNPYMSLGQTIHSTLELFHKDDHKSLDDLLDIYNQVWVNEGFQSPQQTMHFYEKGEKMLRQYNEWCKLRKSEVIFVEKEFRFPLGSRMLRGIIDRIDRLPDDTYEVIDYKTHAEMWEQSRIDSDLQLTLYSLGCQKMLNVGPPALSYLFLAHNKFVTTTRSSLQIRQAIAEFEDVAERIERNDFTPDVTKCAKCDFKQTCAHSSSRTVVTHANSR